MKIEKQTLILFSIIALYPLLGMGIDLISPSLPSISESLHATPSFAKNLISIYFLGSGIGNFFCGILGDFLSRRKSVLIGLLIFAAASLLPTLIPTESMLLCSRFSQGIAIGIFAVSARGSIPHLFPTERIAHISTLLSTAWGLGPILGPLIGGYLQTYFNSWHAGFYFFALYSFICFLLSYHFFPETLHHTSKPSLPIITSNFKELLSDRVFVNIILIMSLIFAVPVVFNTLAPFVVEYTLGYSARYFGELGFLMGFSFLVGTVVCRRLVKNHSAEKITGKTSAFLFFPILFFCALNLYFGDNLFILLIPSALMFFAFGIMYPAGFGKIISLFKHISSLSGAMMILTVSFVGSAIGFGMSFITDKNTLSINLIYLIIIALSWVMARGLMQKNITME